MAFVLCRACGNQVSPDASSCPRCGATTPAVAESGSSPATGATPSPFRKPPAPASARDAAESAPPPSSRLAPDVERKGGAPARQTRSASTRVHGMIVAGLLIILLFLWYGLANRQPAPSPTLATTSAPTSRRHLSSAQRQAANEALQALKALESVTTAGVTYRDYAPRVLDAKVTIDRYLINHRDDDEAIARSIKRAADLYVLASSAWSVSTGVSDQVWYDLQRFVPERRAAVAEMCPAALTVWDEITQNKRFYGELLRRSLPDLWGCASEALAEVQRLVGATG